MSQLLQTVPVVVPEAECGVLSWLVGCNKSGEYETVQRQIEVNGQVLQSGYDARAAIEESNARLRAEIERSQNQLRSDEIARQAEQNIAQANANAQIGAANANASAVVGAAQANASGMVGAARENAVASIEVAKQSTLSVVGQAKWESVSTVGTYAMYALPICILFIALYKVFESRQKTVRVRLLTGAPVFRDDRTLELKQSFALQAMGRGMGARVVDNGVFVAKDGKEKFVPVALLEQKGA